MASGVTMCRMELKNSAEARSVASKELVREMKVPKNPQRPVEQRWSPPCLGWEFMSNSIRSSKEKMTLDNAWVRLAMDYPNRPPPYTRADGLKCKPQYAVSLLGAFQWLPRVFRIKFNLPGVLGKRALPHMVPAITPSLLKPSISFQPNQVTHNLQTSVPGSSVQAVPSSQPLHQGAPSHSF